MRHFLVCVLLALTAFQYSPLIAQKTSDDWRISKRIRTETNGQQFTSEYSYSEDGRIKTVKYLTATGATNITISNFKFTRSGQPSSYLITWNMENATASIALTYDEKYRVKELRKIADDRDITTFTYSYTDKTITVVEKKVNPGTPGTVKDNSMSYYTEQGDYNETVSDAASQTITSTITLKEGNRNGKIIPDDFLGGFDAPRLLGVAAFGSEPDVKAEKNDQGLVTSVVWTNRTGSRKNEYVYAKIKNNGTVTKQDPEIAKADAKPYVEKPRVTGRNIFDARKNFVRSPIKFIAFTVTPDAAQKGFKMDSVYTWTAPDGKVKQASGAEILNQVNDMEKELNLRGHTLRKRNAFSDLSFKLVNPSALLKTPKLVPKNVKTLTTNTNLGNKFSKIPIINTKHHKLPDVTNALATMIGGDVGVYFGSVSGMAGEFQGSISTTGMIDNSKCNKQCPIDITLSLDAKMISSLNITNCILEISDNPDRKPNDTENTLATANFNFKKPAAIKVGTKNMTVSGDGPPSFHTLYYFPVKINDLSMLPKAVIKPVVYYAYVKFYNDKGQLLYYSSYNTAILENKIDAPLFIRQDKKVDGSFDNEYMDPTEMFGVYYASKNINATYATSRDEETLIITETTNVSGDIELGAQYYNFWHLLDDDQPKVTRKSFISASYSAEYKNRYNSMVPGIRIPGVKKSNEMNGYPGYQVNYSLYEQSFDKSSPQDQLKTIAYNVFDERFFIGPVPCRITVDVKGNARLTRNATMDTLTDGSVVIATSVMPHLDLTLTGSGGVDAAIAYAKIVTNVKVIEVDLPITTRASKDADISADLKISALSGQIYFTAGLCIPIPWFDDICTDFRVDIFNWTGPNKTYPLVK